MNQHIIYGAFLCARYHKSQKYRTRLPTLKSYLILLKLNLYDKSQWSPGEKRGWVSKPATGHSASTSYFDLLVRIYVETHSLKEFIHHPVLHSHFLCLIPLNRIRFHYLSWKFNLVSCHYSSQETFPPL